MPKMADMGNLDIVLDIDSASCIESKETSFMIDQTVEKQNHKFCLKFRLNMPKHCGDIA